MARYNDGRSIWALAPQARGANDFDGMVDYALIGDGATGTSAAFYIRRQDPDARIRIYSDDPVPAYYRAALTNYLMGELRPEQLFAVPPGYYAEWDVERVHTRVRSIDTRNQRLDLSNGQAPPYDRLLVAAGARATSPGFPGSELSGVMTMRTLQDARTVMDQISSGRLKRAVIVGGGILGLEWVAGLRARKVEVTYLIRGSAFMAGVLDRAASDLVLSRCRHFGVDIRMAEEIGEIIGRDGAFWGVRLKSSGAVVEADLLGLSVGITPNLEFLEGSGIDTGRGIPVDEHMRTNDANVFAGGDIAEVSDPRTQRRRLLGLWEPARHQGRVAGINMAGGSASWSVPVDYNATRLYDLDLAAVGDSVEQAGDDVEVDFPQSGGSIAYRKLVFRGTRLAGALLLGHRRERVRLRGRLLRRLVDTGADVGPVRTMLLDPFFDLAGWIESSLPPAPRGPPARMTMYGPAPRPTMVTLFGRPAMAPAAAPERAAPRPALATLMRPAPDELEAPPAAAAAGGAAPEPVPLTGPAGLPEVPRPTTRGEAVAPLGRLELGGDVVEIRWPESTIGRDPESQVRVGDPAVSWSHAQVTRQGTSLYLRDLGSRNGTFVNAQLVTLPHALSDGDRIHVGNSDLTFRAAGPLAPGEAPPPVPAESEPAAAQSRVGNARLISLDGPMLGVSFSVAARALVGRNPKADISLNDATVSWNHLVVEAVGSGWTVRDLGSTNGTFVNGTRLTEARVDLSHGDEVLVGRVALRFDMEGGAS